MQMPQSGLAFIGSPVQITGDLPVEILSGHVVRRCRQEEIATVKSHLIRFGMPTMGLPLPYELSMVEQAGSEGAQHSIEQLPEGPRVRHRRLGLDATILREPGITARTGIADSFERNARPHVEVGEIPVGLGIDHEPIPSADVVGHVVEHLVDVEAVQHRAVVEAEVLENNEVAAPVGVAVSPVLVVPNGDADFVLELIDLIHRFEDAPPFPAGGRQPSLGVI